MATRSTINVRISKSEILSIYCHFDGYIIDVGNKLFNHYDTLEKAKQLVNMGDMSFLKETIEESQFYHRDAHEELNIFIARSVEDINEQQYNYLFEGGKWTVNGIDLQSVLKTK
jgi:hypothetical protein